MLRITIELIPSDGSPASVIATGEIINDGTGTSTSGNYYARFQCDGHPDKLGKVRKFRRKRWGPWALLCQALNASTKPR